VVFYDEYEILERWKNFCTYIKFSLKWDEKLARAQTQSGTAVIKIIVVCSLSTVRGELKQKFNK